MADLAYLSKYCDYIEFRFPVSIDAFDTFYRRSIVFTATLCCFSL